MSDDFTEEKARAAAWFRQLRDEIVAAFEGLEDSHDTGPFAEAAPGRFEVSETSRASESVHNARMSGSGASACEHAWQRNRRSNGALWATTTAPLSASWMSPTTSAKSGASKTSCAVIP